MQIQRLNGRDISRLHISPLSRRDGIYAVRISIIVCALLFLTACGSEPTPFPAQIATSTPDIPISGNIPISVTPSVSAIRYGIDPSLSHISLLIDPDYTRISSQMPITHADLGVTYDLAIRLGDADGWSRLPNPITIGMILRPSYEFTDLLWRAIDPPEWIDSLDIHGALPVHDGTTPIPILRADMANLGKPDGFIFNMGIQNMIGERQIQTQLSMLFIETRPVALSTHNWRELWHDGAIDMMIVSWLTEAERVEWANSVGEANLLPLFTAPMSYIASPHLMITLSEVGLPRVMMP